MSLQQVQGFWPVVIALAGNLLVATIKFFAAAASGSSTMLSEAIHSVADTVNQILLLIGLKQSQKKADDRYEYGYGNERFFWALLSASAVFFIGSGLTANSGVEALLSTKPLEFNLTTFVVLVISFGIEFYTFRLAARRLASTFPRLSWRERIEQADSSTLAVLLEDFVAVLGIMIATICIGITYATGNTVWDAIGSLIISALLAIVAIILIMKNRKYLLGHAMPEEMQEAIIATLEADPAIEKVIDFKSSVLGLGVYRIKFEVEWNGTALLPEAYPESTLRDEYEEIRNDFELFKRFAAEHADRLPRLIGRKIDQLEMMLKKRFPSVRHIDIELN